MRYRLAIGFLLMHAPAALFAGVDVWTTNAPAAAGNLVVDSVTGGVYAGAPNGLVRSDDHGATWTPACSEGGPSAVPLAARAGTVYVLATDRSLYASADGGRHCVSVFENLVAPNVGTPGPTGRVLFETVEVVADPFTTGTLYRATSRRPPATEWESPISA